jgi:hypothetical protein
MAVDVRQMILDGSGFTTNEKKVDMYESLLKNYPNGIPLTVILSALTKKKATNVRADWIEEEEIPTEVVNNGGEISATPADSPATGQDSMTCSNADYLREHDILLVPSSFEMVEVSATPAEGATSVVINRGAAGTTKAVIKAGETLILLAPAFDEGSTDTNPRVSVNSNYYNVTQVFREFTRVSKSANEEATWFSPVRVRNQQKMFYAFQKKVERTLYFGQRYVSGDTRYMGGLMWRFATADNVWDINGPMTESALDDFLTSLAEERPDNDNLSLFCSYWMAGKLSQMAKGKIVPNDQSTKEYGVQIDTYKGSVPIKIVRCPLLKGPTFKNMGFVLNLNNMALKWLRQPAMEFNTGNPSDDFIQDQMVGEGTLIMALQKTHGLIKRATA